MPSVSLFGLVGNSLSIYILHHREVKLKKGSNVRRHIFTLSLHDKFDFVVCNVQCKAALFADCSTILRFYTQEQYVLDN